MPHPSPASDNSERRSPWPAFSTDEMLDVIRDVFRPGWTKGLVACQGKTYRTLVSNSGKPLTGLWEFPLFFEPVADQSPALAVRYLDSVCHQITEASAPASAAMSAAPFIDWSALPLSWDQFLETCSPAPGADGFETLRRKDRALHRDLGAVQVCFDDPDPEVFRALTAWKSAQYRRTGVVDLFSLQRNREFYAEMTRRRILQVASLRAGGRLLAAHAGNRVGGRFLYRLPAFDPAFGRYSPGALLTSQLVRHSLESGDREFDFLLGAESYKFTYATHVRWVGPLGREPLLSKSLRKVRSFAGSMRRDARLPAAVSLRAPLHPGPDVDDQE